MPISKMAVFGIRIFQPAAKYYKMANMDYQEFAVEMGFYDSPQPYAFQIYSEVLQKFRLGRRRAWRRSAARTFAGSRQTMFYPIAKLVPAI